MALDTQECSRSSSGAQLSLGSSFGRLSSRRGQCALLLFLSCLCFAETSSLAGKDLSQMPNSRRVIKARFLQDLKSLQETTDTDLSKVAQDSYAHLLELCMDANGNANPRITCTDGYGQAASYVKDQMEEMGLIPAGDAARTTYLQTVVGSIDETFCPTGIQNVIGIVEGTVYPNEYIVYSAHLDGANNENPQTDKTRGNMDTSDAYDDGFAVAVGLAIAKQLAENPPARSVIFLFDDGEEGWKHVGVRSVGQSSMDVCQTFVDSDWYNTVYKATGGDLQTREDCPPNLIGSSYWVLNPTVDMSKIKMAFFIDPLGAAFDAPKNVLATLGGDQTRYINDGTEIAATLDDLLDNIWPKNSTVDLIKGPRAALPGYSSSMDVFQKNYPSLCGDNCLSANGVPSVMLSQPAFQRFHGGSAIRRVKNTLGAMIDNALLPSPAHFSLDNLAAFYLPNSNDMVNTLNDLVRSTANSERLDSLSFDSEKGSVVDKKDMENVVGIYHSLFVESRSLPEAAAQMFLQVVEPLKREAQIFSQADLTDPDIQYAAVQVAQTSVLLLLSLDYFNENYPQGEEFLDQTVQRDGNTVADEPAPSTQPSVVDDPRLAWPTLQPSRAVVKRPSLASEPSPSSMPPVATNNPTGTDTVEPTMAVEPTAKPSDSSLEPAPPTATDVPVVEPTSTSSNGIVCPVVLSLVIIVAGTVLLS